MNETEFARAIEKGIGTGAGRPSSGSRGALSRGVGDRSANPDALNLLGVQALQRGEAQTAVDWISRAVRVSPKTALYQNNLGVALQKLKRFIEAASCFKAAARLEPEFFDAQFNLGAVLLALDRADEAVVACQKALSVRKDPVALNNLGAAHRKRRDFPAAVRCFEQVLELVPGDPDALYHLATVLNEGGQFERAVACFEKRARLPNPPTELADHLGLALQQCGRFNEAETCYRQALKTRPSAAVSINLAIILNQRFALEEAEQLLRQAIHLRPDDPEAFNNLGNVLLDAERPVEAERAYDEAIRLKPDYVDAIYNRAHARLILGDFAGGLSDYEFRWRWKDFPSPKPTFPQPEWAGDDLNGRTLLVYNEQGLGDTIQFSRYFAVAVPPEGGGYCSLARPSSGRCSRICLGWLGLLSRIGRCLRSMSTPR